jgi:CRP-like cAMP-binding protein
MAAQSLEEQLAARGLKMLGPLEHLSQCTGLMEQAALLRDFTPPEADLLGANMQLVRAQAGQLLIAEDEASDWMMLLLSGVVDVGKRRIAASDTEEAGEVTRLAVLKAGATLGEMSMLDGEPRYASCWALCDVEAAILSRAAVGRLITAHPGVGAKLLVKLTQLLAQRLRNTSSQLVKTIQKNAASAA